MNDDDEFERVPPSAQRVAARALALAAVVCRGALEKDASDPGAIEVYRELREWVATVDVDAEFEVGEQALISAKLGTLTKAQSRDASWRAEGMAVLAWALSRYALPSYAESVSSSDVAECLGLFHDRRDTVLANPVLRTPDELEHFREQMMDLHWRFVHFSKTREPVNYEGFSRQYMRGHADLVGFTFAARDLAIDGIPLTEVPDARRHEAHSIVRERHQAANWLAGDAAVYSEVGVDT